MKMKPCDNGGGGTMLKPKPNAVAGRKGRKASTSEIEEEFEVANPISKSRKRKGAELDVVPATRRPRPKRAAASTSLKEVHHEIEAQYVTPKDEKIPMLEQEALVLTSQEKDESRLLLDFFIHDGEGETQPLDVVGSHEVYVTCLMAPHTSSIVSIDKSKAVLCESMGPILEWGIEGYDKGEPSVYIGTGLSFYTLVQPSGRYKKHFNLLLEKVTVCVEVYRALSPSTGGDPQLGLNDLFARVARSLRSGKYSSALQFFTRDYLIEQGGFIAGQLKALDGNADDDEQLFSGLPAIDVLESECLKRATQRWSVDVKPEALKIKDASASNGTSSKFEENDDQEQGGMDADEKLARHLQEMENRNLASRNGRNQPAGKGRKVYIKINEAEIANDYPLPAYYKAEEDETDEYLFFDDDNAILAPHELPQRMLHDWTLYNSDSRLVSLELLPMLSGVETDAEIFGSGMMTEDEDSAFTFDDEDGEVSSSLIETTSSSSNGNGISHKRNSIPQGIRLYLSAIKEWMIEFGANMIFISIRTDGAWYRLGKPSKQYRPWYAPVMKTARLAVKAITMLKQQQRVSRLSFSDIVKRLTDYLKEDSKFNFVKAADVERYLVVHGQIILQQFAEYPEEQIRRSAFVTGLIAKMEEKHHVKLTVSKKTTVIKKGRNLNPRAHLQPDAKKSKPMRATTTILVNRIWSNYYTKFNLSGEMPTVIKEEETVVAKEDKSEEEEEEEDDDDDEDEDEEELEDDSSAPAPKPSALTLKKVKKINVDRSEIVVGEAVLVNLDDDTVDSEKLPSMLLVEYLYDSRDKTPMLHGRVLVGATETVLGNAGDDREVFLTNNCADVEISGVQKVVVNMKRRTESYKDRKTNALADEAERARAKERELQGLPKEYFCRAVYSPDKGAFFSLPTREQGLAVGNGSCKTCIQRDEEEKMSAPALLDVGGFRLEGVEYRIGDYLYVDSTVFKFLVNKDEPEAEVVFKGGRNKGLRPFAVCQLLSVQKANRSNVLATKINVQRFYRPDDFGSHRAYVADVHEVYYSEDTVTVEISTVRGRCDVLRPGPVIDSSIRSEFHHLFLCSRVCDPKTGTVKQLPATVKLSSYCRLTDNTKNSSAAAELKAKAKGKGKAIEDEDNPSSAGLTACDNRLATLDIFAGCGGLSEGLRQAGVATTKWAIEYEHPASEAFNLNHPETNVFCENCNVILRCIMERGGDSDECLSTPDAQEMASALSDEKKKLLPAQGEVDFINGGPPCQGFSGMNRFNTGAWSKVQCEMILGFLSYAEYFRPRYFLLENVRNFVSFNKGQTFRLTLATLLEMGYQVRFGVLQAGNYGVSQSRKRAFIWAAAPNEILPEWPEPMHVFGSSQLKIALPGGASYAAVRDAGKGAPLRAMTVKDTIYDLPPVENGASKEEIKYSDPPVSWFQKQIRGNETALYDHIAKEMNELNLERCKHIPKYPGADWRTLPDIKIKLSTGTMVDLIPWCLPNTADRHNQWKGLFGRLDWDGNFPTSVTDPQPMGKVGMCFHPEQDRIVTVRECARSQGFPDSYKFSGTIQSKHRQIGNAVPPPLARALGLMLKAAIRLKEGS
ncbi:DNA (cytosine-5)-methyltransferase 1A isoform X2 [Physcomitrium patens]|uniref:DNA (cytosine-5)-methyltransferase n=1 Tax=Physcomitrium patens TaxID=3218 RepID=A0A2K1JVH1_PHYPA|nr:DNA (cytosine-5)-methyltransferase 1A-like [Physcomitrium patens]PNR45522.1 hypothetical protein PHYPA_015293 [Physcomitrium patens]|eukprot:XP_024387799.1 DNA (cytosine-5)-methyltransferase 1A-like [Physcomitrella patens]